MSSAVHSLYRLRKPKGRLVLATIGHNMFAPASGLFLDLAQAHVPGLAVDLPWRKTEDLTALRAIVKESGVGAAKFARAAYATDLTDVSDWWQIMMGSGFRSIALRMDDDGLQRVRYELEMWLTRNDVRQLTTTINYVVCETP